jgi:hypothetical protein
MIGNTEQILWPSSQAIYLVCPYFRSAVNRKWRILKYSGYNSVFSQKMPDLKDFLIPNSHPSLIQAIILTLSFISVVNCGNPGAVSNARRTGSSFTYNSVVSYTCNPGYRISGSERRTCQGDGTWSGISPKCSSMFPRNKIIARIISEIFTILMFDIQLNYLQKYILFRK